MTTKEIVNQHIGRKRIVTRAEMQSLLLALHRAGLHLANPYVVGTEGEPRQAAEIWARACHGITCISTSMDGYLRDGQVRYDAPGSMNPSQHAEIMFVSRALTTYEYDQVGQLRRHAARVLIVSDAEETWPEIRNSERRNSERHPLRMRQRS